MYVTHFLFISGGEIFFIMFIVVMVFGADKIPGIANGIITVKSIFISFDPSKIATSLNDLGILLKAFRIINIPNGTMAIVCNKINAKCLSIKPVLKSNLYSGIIKVTLGIRSGKSRKMKKNSLNLNLKKVNA